MMDAQKEKKLCFFKNTSQIKDLRYNFRKRGQFGFVCICLYQLQSRLFSCAQNILRLYSMGSHHYCSLINAVSTKMVPDFI
jgi:hypothetical protein